MTTTIVRTAEGWWVQTGSGVARIDTNATTTRELLSDRAAIDDAAVSAQSHPIESLDLVSPVTAPCRIVGQLTNYASHAADVGLNPTKVPLAFFRKASGSISGPYDSISRPSHVRLLDYEVEVGLVIGRDMPVGTTVTEHNWTDYVAGLVAANDISARDVQLSKTQYYEAKSYPSFTPVGPALVLMSRAELARIGDLRLKLSVNNQIRQDSRAGGDMIYSPKQALQALSKFQRLDVGDLIITGTPIGTALSAPPKIVEKLIFLLSPTVRWKLFFSVQSRNPRYLRPGDVVELEVATDDGKIDLGSQSTTVLDR